MCKDWIFFMLRLTHTARIKRWATLFDLLGSCCKRLFKYKMSKDDTKGWLDDCCHKHFFVTRVPFQLNISFKWKLLCLISIFYLSFCTKSLIVSSWDIWENMAAQMISSLNFWSETQVEPWEVYKGFETRKRRREDPLAN